MNALKRFSGTHKQRNDKQLISLALEHFLLASALTLHEDFRFGKDRIERYVNSMLPRMGRDHRPLWRRLLFGCT